ncbi:MAG: hypothetical protein LBM65_01995 [Oscillospiraceae bacterium]|jgi:hypothetical protein|nr:hypothetical protein [Oscillospiraceae bacterium]
MKEVIHAQLRRVGDDVVLHRGEHKTHTKAFVQPLRYRNSTYLSGESISPGYYDDHHYLYIGLPEDDFAQDTKNLIIEHCSGKYVVNKTESYTHKNKVMYVWAILSPYVEAEVPEYE